ncbi:hypothetical protein DEO72_LG8g2168 [Vigna unguiculata]|uniref:Uncharacterized protein n=1 Tax=Vigna unguiculata TaxID=3917 RepID=A0A4D6MW72_VIGUN|nr:hypothetical protein DEO72_LG8g2168 [Vigna unguiculata]
MATTGGIANENQASRIVPSSRLLPLRDLGDFFSFFRTRHPRTVCGCLVVGDGGPLVAIWCRFVMEVIMGEYVLRRNNGVD